MTDPDQQTPPVEPPPVAGALAPQVIYVERGTDVGMLILKILGVGAIGVVLLTVALVATCNRANTGGDLFAEKVAAEMCKAWDPAVIVAHAGSYADKPETLGQAKKIAQLGMDQFGPCTLTGPANRVYATMGTQTMSRYAIPVLGQKRSGKMIVSVVKEGDTWRFAHLFIPFE